MNILIPVLDFTCLIGLVLAIRWWKKRHGQLTEKQYAMITLGYGSFFVITSVHPIYLETHSHIALWIEIGLLLLVWTLGFPYTRWLYKQFISKK